MLNKYHRIGASQSWEKAAQLLRQQEIDRRA